MKICEYNQNVSVNITIGDSSFSNFVSTAAPCRVGENLMSKEKKGEKITEEIECSEKLNDSGTKCPSCGKSSDLRWCLNNDYGVCNFCGKTWPLKNPA